MNYQLNKDLFTETGCIRYDRLLQYRNGKLNEADKHEMEMHLVDCPLCSDALEGFMLVTTGNAVDEVKNELREMVNSGSQVNLKKYYFAAASVAAIILLAVVSYYQFREVKIERLAVKETVEQSEPAQLNETPIQDSVQDNESVEMQKQDDENREALFQRQQSANLSTSPRSQINTNQSLSIGAAPVVLPPFERQSATIGEAEQAEIADSEPVKDEAAGTTASFNLSGVVSERGTVTPAPSDNFITYVDNLKIIDYKDINTEDKNNATLENATPSKYQNVSKKESAVAEELKSGDKALRKTTYAGFIAAPVMLYNQGLFESAVKGFDEILAMHPNDQNALFYKGMSMFQLKNFNQAITLLTIVGKTEGSPFTEEARYYTAKSYVAVGDTKKGALLLKEIVSGHGFYASQAGEELKKLKK